MRRYARFTLLLVQTIVLFGNTTALPLNALRLYLDSGKRLIRIGTRMRLKFDVFKISSHSLVLHTFFFSLFNELTSNSYNFELPHYDPKCLVIRICATLPPKSLSIISLFAFRIFRLLKLIGLQFEMQAKAHFWKLNRSGSRIVYQPVCSLNLTLPQIPKI